MFALRFLIFSETKYGTRKITWREFCKKFNISVTTANRYINFKNWCLVYPRLIVCGMELTTLEAYREELEEHLQSDIDLKAKLEAPVREMVIEGKKRILRQENLPRHMDNDQPVLEEIIDDWDPGFEFRDQLLDEMDDEDLDDTILDDEEYTSLFFIGSHMETRRTAPAVTMALSQL